MAVGGLVPYLDLGCGLERLFAGAPLNDYLPAPFFVKKIFVGVDYFFQRRAPFQNSRKPCRRRFARILKRCAAT